MRWRLAATAWRQDLPPQASAGCGRRPANPTAARTGPPRRPRASSSMGPGGRGVGREGKRSVPGGRSQGMSRSRGGVAGKLRQGPRCLCVAVSRPCLKSPHYFMSAHAGVTSRRHGPATHMSTSSSSPSDAPSGIHWADPARQQAFAAWLASVAPAHGLRPETLRSASSDASFRRYFRVDAQTGSFIVMDAPPDKEDSHPFVAVDRLLDAGGVNVPHILAWDEARGFMLLSDLGHHTLLSVLVADQPPDAGNRQRYAAALHELVRLQQVQQGQGAQGLPPNDDALLQRELDLFPDWYLGPLRQATLGEPQSAQLAQALTLIKAQVLGQATVLVLREYLSLNL